MNSFPVVGLVGLQGSGKTQAARELVRAGAARVRMGDVVWRELERRGLEISEEEVGRVANKIREEEGRDAIAKRCLPLIEERGEEAVAVVVDGIRSIAEVERFREEFGEDFFLISIEASEETRYRRIEKRGREDDTVGRGDFEEKESRELGWGLKEAMSSADYRIENEGSLEELREKILDIFEEVLGEYES